jgi:predicted RNA binding protein YcfA (HicA-like mRNA interferase family)
MKIRDAIRLVEKDGWRMVVQEGSHRQYKHPTKKGRVTIAGHPSMDLDKKTQRSILNQAGLK